ncbi:MAG: 4a-hydroxytetrahydrobiopterin dehydratase [Actinobacteria bacterium]|nr:4a-hydroxytetrahydrobiopterin dehydratase [Actinomycetota bacterium]
MSDSCLTPPEIDAAALTDWRQISRALHTRFRTGKFATGLALVNAIGAAAEEANHHPDLGLRYAHLNIRLFSHDASGVTERDVALARRISELAAGLGVPAEPTATSVVELALDSPDYQRIKPFWRAVMGYSDNPRSGDEVRNDDSDLPPIWFQESGDEEPRQRFHIDIRVPPEVVQQRIDEAVAAGGEMLYEAPTFIVLADADGNRVCVCRS